jgi:putative N6-adenine-specific DNA methylase
MGLPSCDDDRNHAIDRDVETSQGYEFYLIVAPGFEALALQELERWSIPGILVPPAASRGGITLQLADQSVGFALNRVLKIPTRVLIRIAKFGCRDFPKLFKKVSQLPWETWVSDSDRLSFQASSHASRLFVKKRIEQTCEEARERFLKNRNAIPSPEGREVSVLVRIDDDVCTISLDTSGELLHKRGMRPLSSDAPIRETIASALLQFMEKIPNASAQPIELVDPMMGGGTFFLEAMLIRERIVGREFAFEKFATASANEVKLTPSDRSPFESFHGFELSEKTIAAARENLSDLFGAEAVSRLKTSCEDIFEAKPLPPHPNRWLVTNPPYGERLKISVPLGEYYKNLFAACERVFQPTRACFVLPEKSRPLSLSIPTNWKRVADLPFSNGGLPVRAVVYERKHLRG